MKLYKIIPFLVIFLFISCGDSDPSIPTGCTPVCNNWESCEEGVCIPLDGYCNLDSDCDSGEYCNLDTHHCEPSGCLNDTECKEWEYCHISTGICVITEGRCISDTNCSVDKPKCDIDTHYCVEDSVTDPCEGVTCSNFGVCIDNNGVAECNCNDGYHAEGLNCVENSVTDPCEGVNCSNFGVCIDNNGVAECNCNDGYHAEGLNCIENSVTDPCEGVTCSNFGICIDNNGVAECNCNDGYHAEGLNCVEDVVIDPCEGVICPTNSHCEEGDCLCDDGYNNVGTEDDPNCVQSGTLGDSCDNPFEIITASGVFQGSTTNMGSNFTSSSCSQIGTLEGKDVVYPLILSNDSYINITLSSEFDAVLYIISENCENGNEYECIDYEYSGDEVFDNMEQPLEAGTYYVIIDGFGATSYGDYDLDVTISPIISVCSPNPCSNIENGDGECIQTGSNSYICGCDPNYFFQNGNCVSPCDGENAPICTGEQQKCLASDIDTPFCGCIDGYVDTTSGETISCEESFQGEDSCLDPDTTEITESGLWYGSTLNYSNNLFMGWNECTGSSEDGNDSVYRVVLSEGDTIDVVLEKIDSNTDWIAIYLIDDQICNSGAQECITGEESSLGETEVSISYGPITADQAGVYYLVVDSFDEGSYLDYIFMVDIY